MLGPRGGGWTCHLSMSSVSCLGSLHTVVLNTLWQCLHMCTLHIHSSLTKFTYEGGGEKV